jgi:Flp pilus assembly pilin Flp
MNREALMTRPIAKKPTTALTRLARDERGATLMEYLMLAGLVAIAAFAGFKLFGANVQTAITTQADTVTTIPAAAQ